MSLPPVTALSSVISRRADRVGYSSFRFATALLLLAGAVPPLAAQRPRAPVRSAQVSFSFVNAPLADVVAGVVRDALGRRFRIAPNLTGRVTVVTDGPVTPARALQLLDAGLRDAGARLSDVDGVIEVVAWTPPPPTPVVNRPPPPPPPPPEPTEEVVAITGVDPAALLTVLRAMLPPAVTASLAEGGGIRLVGTTADRRDAAELIRLFDSQLAGRAFTMVQLDAGTPEALIRELGTLGATGGVQLLPIERAGAILVIGDPTSAAQAVRTIQALDQGSSLGNRQLFIYPVAHGRASDLARVLGGLYNAETEGEDDSAAAQRPGLVDRGAVRAADTGDGRARAGADPSEGGIVDRPARVANREQALAFGNDRVRIVADERGNSIAVLATRGEWRLIEDFLRRLDVQPLQVYIEATIAEVTLNDRLQYGLQWFFQSGDFTGLLSDADNGSVATRSPGFSGTFTSGTDVRFVLDALKAVTNVKVVSSPQLTVLNNQTATLQVGADVPVATRSAVSTIDPDAPIVNNIEFRSTGVILRVTPRANAGGMVTVDIEQEVSDVVSTDTSSLNSPTIQQRRVESTVAVRSGETIALAGLIQDRDERGRRGLPILSSIPLFGALFGTKTRLVGRTELLVMMTPRLIGSSADVRQLTEDLRVRMRALPPIR